MTGTTLLVVVKEPRAGRVKTRLTPPCSPRQAADLAAAALADTLAVVGAVPAARRVVVLEGRLASVPDGFEVTAQGTGRLDERIAAALAQVEGPVLLVGMDTPQLTPDLLRVDWAGVDAWLGPACDGGFWALGLRCSDPALVLGVAMSTPRTGGDQYDRLRRAGLRVGLLPALRDVDVAADAEAVAALAPGTRFAREWAAQDHAPSPAASVRA